MSEDPQNVYKGTLDTAKTGDIELPLADAGIADCSYYTHAYGEASSRAEAQGMPEQGKLYQFLTVLCSFHATYENRELPYQPMMVMDGKRSIVPDDLTGADLEVVAVLFERAADFALKARLGDVLWICRKDHEAARIAAEQFVASGTRLIASEHGWSQAMDEFTRAIQLSSLLGRKNEPFLSIERNIEEIALALPTDERTFRACQMLEVLLDQEAGHPDKMIGLAAKLAEANHDEPHKERAYWDVECRWLRRAGKKEEARQAGLKAAETLVREGEMRVQGADPSYLAGSRFLAQGIEALRRNGGDPARIMELKKSLLEWQGKIRGEMKVFQGEVDLTDAVSKARNYVGTDDFERAVLRLALGHPLVSPAQLRQKVLDAAKRYPITHLFGAMFVDHDGRVLERGIGLLNPAAPGFEDEVDAQMVQHATLFIWGLRAAAFIEPARQEIQQRNRPRLGDIIWLIQGHPFVPAGHEEIICRGLLAGFDGDWIMAAHLLVPQIENSFRNVLQLNGVDVSNLMSDLTQPLKVSAQVISHPKAKEFFGEDVVFEMRGLLLEKRGYQLRHRLAHGMVDVSDCCSPAVVNIWWLFLRLCAIGHLNASAATANSDEKERPPAASERAT